MDLISEAKKTIERGDRVLVTTLTKRMAEDLTDYLVKEGLRVRYMHSEIDSLDRIELIRQLRAGEYDILVGINLLREGLDVQLNNLPRVKGAAIVLDDYNEKMYPIRIRPRFTWHGGSAPSAIHKKKEWF